MLAGKPTSEVKNKDLSKTHSFLVDVSRITLEFCRQDQSFLPRLAGTQLFLEDTSQTIAQEED
jgi:hypothetical protein